MADNKKSLSNKMKQSKVPAELPGLTGLRGAFALSVLLFHLGLLPGGWFAVDGFFLLSGVVLGHVYQGKDFVIREFLWHRFARVMPITWLTVILASISMKLAGHPPTATDFTSAMLLFPVIFDHGRLIVGTIWSLAVEWVLYFLFPILRLLSPSRNIRIFCIILCLMGSFILTWETAFMGGIYVSPWMVLRGLFPFLAGVISRPLLTPKLQAIRLLDWSPIKWLGEISLPLYLLQLPILRYLPTHSLWAIPITLALSALLHYSIEKPARRWLRKVQFSGQ